MRKSFTTSFDYGDSVTLKTEPDTVRVVNGFLVRKGSVMIGLARGDDESWHQMTEIIEAKKIFKVKGFK